MTASPILWSPTPAQSDATAMARYIRWLGGTRGLTFADYPALWDWSVSDLPAFWTSIVDFFDIKFSTPATTALGARSMPGADWFPGARLNYADQILRHAVQTPHAPAVAVTSETFGETTLSFAELHARVASVAHHLTEMGVTSGDRVVATLPNTETALIAFLATASIGAVWSLCAPDMGHVAILDRFQQIAPKVLIAQTGYTHAGKFIDRSPLIDTIRDGLTTLTHSVILPVNRDLPPGAVHWDDLTQTTAPLTTSQVAFDHPLWIVYSSGTTGNPKPIVHGHGGVLLEAAKQSLHLDIQPGDRFAWMTSSGWIMWNSQWGALATGAMVALFDAAPHYPDMMALWRFADHHRLTYLGAGAAFFSTCLKSGIIPKNDLAFDHLRAIGSTGSPLSSDGYDWIYGAVKSDVWLAPISGGTDLAGAFVCGHPMLPVRAGAMQCRALGNAVRAYDPAGNEVFDTVGELVCTEPLPSMPLYFWGDTDGSRLHESYFDTYPGIWRHGDWIEIAPDGASIIYGRSDATINRKGLRLGSAEIYQAVEALPEILDSLVIDLEFLGQESFMPLFVVLPDGQTLTDPLRDKINMAIRTAVSARFIPNEIVQITAVPRTLSGKKLEVPVKKLLLGGDPKTVVNRDSMANPDSFDFFVAYAAARADG